LLHDVTFGTIIFKFTGKNWKLSSVKLIRKRTDVHDRQQSSKLVAVGQNGTNSWRMHAVKHAVIRLQCVQCSQLFLLFWHSVTSFELWCRSSDSPHTWI